MLVRSVTDNARYDPFDLVDAALSGNAAHAVSVLDHLRAEGTAPALVLWVLTDTARTLLRLGAGEQTPARRLPPARAALLHRRTTRTPARLRG